VIIPKPLFEPLAAPWASLGVMRTCNCCVQGTCLNMLCVDNFKLTDY
jgi:hypothetical protein